MLLVMQLLREKNQLLRYVKKDKKKFLTQRELLFILLFLQICPCKNGGFCKEDESGKLLCMCPIDFHGDTCEVGFASSMAGGAAASIIVPIMVTFLVLLTAAAVFMVLKKRPL